MGSDLLRAAQSTTQNAKQLDRRIRIRTPIQVIKKDQSQQVFNVSSTIQMVHIMYKYKQKNNRLHIQMGMYKALCLLV